MRHQALGKIALMLGVIFAGAATTGASPVRYGDIFALASVVGQSGRPSVDLRMRPSIRQSATPTQQTASNRGMVTQEQKQSSAPDVTTTANVSVGAPANGSEAATSAAASLTGTDVAPQQPAQASNIETVELGEVQGTICDCGAIKIPGGFPKWPWLALGAVPFFFINHSCDTQPCTTDTPPPPTPTPPGVPEPATIFLLGTGLAAVGARARRSYARRIINNEATGEV
jgi:hypothetical protein